MKTHTAVVVHTQWQNVECKMSKTEHICCSTMSLKWKNNEFFFASSYLGRYS